jgi:hypothetical protein
MVHQTGQIFTNPALHDHQLLHNAHNMPVLQLWHGLQAIVVEDEETVVFLLVFAMGITEWDAWPAGVNRLHPKLHRDGLRWEILEVG